ncbi:hypothetical protein M426DRAFT_21365 [Hypoxylon sp. CI-4A]|nr:hypothetical protein M426DRAFT_21365 [Hypoxylon sp. CI-4A]
MYGWLAQPVEKQSRRAAEQVFRTPLPEPLIRERQRQRKISRKKYGVRVSRRLPSSQGTKRSLAGDNKQYSLMQVSEFTEDHPYWGTLRQSQIIGTGPSIVDATGHRDSYKDRPHNQLTSDRNFPAQKSKHADRKVSGRRRKGMSVATRNRGQVREKRYGLADPVVWDAINRSLEQQRRLSSMVIPEEVLAEYPVELEVPERTSSQRKALNRFTRQLEKYADASKAAGGVPIMTPTISDSRVSYHTVQPLLKYQGEFNAAGLAVTSAEQSRKSPIKPRDSRVPINHTPRAMALPVRINGDLDGQDDAVSEQLSSSSGTFVDFTPIGVPIESLPVSKSKAKRAVPPRGKRTILPWLKKKSPAEEIRDTRRASQQLPRPTKDNKAQNRAKHIDPHSSQGYRKPLVPKDSPSQGPETSTPVAHQPRPSKAPADAISEKPSRSSLAKGKQVATGLRPLPVISQAEPEISPRQSVMHTGLRKRDMAMSRLPRPETIEEEKENLPIHHGQETVQIYPPPNPEDALVPLTMTHQRPPDESPQTTPSTIPSLPYTAQYASVRPSSLERALNEVSEQLEKMEQADTACRFCTRPPTATEQAIQEKSPTVQQHSNRKTSVASLSRRPGLDEEFIFVDRKMPPLKSPERKTKKLPAPPPPPPRPTRDAPGPPPKQPLPSPPKGKRVRAVPQTEAILKDLDVFFDYDDADINDRDVIKGLQVAIHAAADNAYDAWIRDKTGLRIRRFLADLRAVGEVEPAKLADKRA